MSKNKNKKMEAAEPQTKAEQAPEQTAQVDAEVRIHELEEQVSLLQQQVHDLEDVRLRQMAEFDNYRRRTNKEKLDLMETAGEGLLKDMLPLLDDFERALHGMQNLTADNLEGFREGVDLIYKKFVQYLEHHQVTAIETEGQPFSTDLHEAITTFAAGDDKKGQIIDCTQRGYKLGDKVIRYAKVVVGE